MSSSSRSDGDNPIDVEELLEIETRCRELRKEKEMLKESQSQGFELIRRLEQHAKSLSEARLQDNKHIQRLERELKNCSQEIDYLQDQLSARNEEVNCLTDHVHNLEIKLADMEILHEKVGQLRGELNRSNSDRLLLMKEIEKKEEELQQSALRIEKLESLSSIALESQCEIESMKLDIMALEQTCLEAKKTEEENFQEKSKMNVFVKELEVQLQNAQEIIEGLDNENKELRGKLITSEKNARINCPNVKEFVKSKDNSQLKMHTLLGEQEGMSTTSNDIRSGSKVALSMESGAGSAEQIKSMSDQIKEYKLLVKQLKEELRDQKLKAKEEAEDLAQEMAELRYQMMGLLEDERKRRACIEQASLQRIAELEAQIQKEPEKAVAVVRHLNDL
ncbi:hypothetical protein CCACVL1_28832 [Corchorus capsularis]|uniref:Uncharacterized protein n=1 Tax=Corchorus capsularis TaxID=210143 RepID=A0A1R3G539_COCAP|nr:hypothetical protein CCACVL1_28832 [Corchorus capsularis]